MAVTVQKGFRVACEANKGANRASGAGLLPPPLSVPPPAPPPPRLQDLLAMVPRPVAAVLLLFPITESTEAARKQGG